MRHLPLALAIGAMGSIGCGPWGVVIDDRPDPIEQSDTPRLRSVCCDATEPTVAWPYFEDAECSRPLVIATPTSAEGDLRAGDVVCGEDGEAWSIYRIESYYQDTQVEGVWYQLGFYGECRSHVEVANFRFPPTSFLVVRGERVTCE